MTAIAAVSSSSSTGVKGAINSPASSFMANAANCASAIARVRRTNLARSDSSSTSSYYGTSIYMDAALDQLRAEGYEVLADDVARLSPLCFKHINMLGRYAFILSDTVARGELRPLRDPRTASLDEA